MQSLAPGEPGSLKVREDGTLLDAHHRIEILRERGLDVDELPREILTKEIDSKNTVKPDVYWINGPWPGSLAILARPRGADWLEDEVAGWKDSGVDVVVSLLTRGEDSELGLVDERELVEQHGLTFISFPIADYGVPTSITELRQLVSNLERSLKRGDSVGIHCRQGIGRSSVVAACVLVTSGESPGNAFHQISSARGRPVPDTSEQRNWVTAFASES